MVRLMILIFVTISLKQAKVLSWISSDFWTAQKYRTFTLNLEKVPNLKFDSQIKSISVLNLEPLSEVICLAWPIFVA